MIQIPDVIQKKKKSMAMHIKKVLGIEPKETHYKGYLFKSKLEILPPKKRISKRADLKDRVFGKLKVIEFIGNSHDGFKWWGCICECGEKVIVRSRELRRGHTKSCGCLSREYLKKSAGRNKMPFGHASRNELLATYKKSARDRKIKWGISDKLFFRLVSTNCIYCNIPPDSYRKPNKQVNGGFYYSGIDRVINNVGYIPGNVVPCCWACNRAKATLSIDEFLEWIKRLADNLLTKEKIYEVAKSYDHERFERITHISEVINKIVESNNEYTEAVEAARSARFDRIAEAKLLKKDFKKQ